MSDTTRPESTAYPYATYLNVLFPALEKIALDPLVASVQHPWYNQTLCNVDDSVVRLGVFEKGDYHWHHHDDEDEFFYVVEGRFFIDLEGRTVELAPQQGFTVPKGVLHRTRAPVRSVVLMIENKGVVPTGD